MVSFLFKKLRKALNWKRNWNFLHKSHILFVHFYHVSALRFLTISFFLKKYWLIMYYFIGPYIFYFYQQQTVIFMEQKLVNSFLLYSFHSDKFIFLKRLQFFCKEIVKSAMNFPLFVQIMNTNNVSWYVKVLSMKFPASLNFQNEISLNSSAAYNFQVLFFYAFLIFFSEYSIYHLYDMTTLHQPPTEASNSCIKLSK